MQKRNKLYVAAVLLLLAGCGETPLEQSLFGAGSGAVGAAVLDLNPAGGALVGAVANVAYCQQPAPHLA